jgi:formamidopyrimidine-DNA glycosylase
MPELPDIVVYVESLESRIVGQPLTAGRLRWLAPGAKLPAITLAAFDFPTGTLAFTEAGTKKRASLHLLRGKSALALTQKLTAEEIRRLYEACRAVLTEWTERLREQVGTGFPENVTAFRPEMAVHGRYGQPCPACGTKAARIVYAENETSYCPRCQAGGALLLSRLLKKNWPKRIDEDD